MRTQPGAQGHELAAISAIVGGWVGRAGLANLAGAVAAWDAEAWELARWVIQVHGIGPLLDWRLADTPEARAVQPLVREYLAEQRQRSGERVGVLLADLAEVLRACAGSGVPVVPLKGSLLATQYYPEPGLRPMNDLDVLIHPDDEPRMLRLLATLGYQVMCRSWKHIMVARPEHYGPMVSWDGEHPANPRSIDVHTRLHEQFLGIQYDLTAHAWADSAPGPLVGSTARLLGPAALLHHLVVHTTGNLIVRGVRQVQLHDISLVAARVDEQGWARIVASAQAQQEKRFLYPALALTERYYGGVPAEVLRELRAGVAPALLRYLDRSSLEQLSLCNASPPIITEQLGWFRPGSEWLRAIRHVLVPQTSNAPSSFQEYARYYSNIIQWVIRRIQHLPRGSAVSHPAERTEYSLRPASYPSPTEPSNLCPHTDG